MNLSMAERALTPEQVAQGQKLAREFKPHPATAPSATASNASGKPNAALSNSSGADGKAGFLIVKADDESCDVYLDGAFIGNAPARLKVVAGAHVIEVKKQGFKDFHREIRVTEGSEQSLHAALEKQ